MRRDHRLRFGTICRSVAMPEDNRDGYRKTQHQERKGRELARAADGP